ncbi:phage integrase domain protein [Halorubrum sp. AJ67]|nr:phage integrase domain protein [Halorubrum sp. AJ67]
MYQKRTAAIVKGSSLFFHARHYQDKQHDLAATQAQLRHESVKTTLKYDNVSGRIAVSRRHPRNQFRSDVLHQIVKRWCRFRCRLRTDIDT